MGKILILENDIKLDEARHHFVFHFLRTYKGERVDFSGLRYKTNGEVWAALNDCTDIITQTCFVNGSDEQFYDFLHLLKKIKQPKNVYIALLGDSLVEWFNDLRVEDLYAIKQHNIFELDYDGNGTKLSFAHKTMPELRRLATERIYKRNAVNRPTGRLIRVLACNGNGKAFEGLKIGETVAEVDMSQLDPNSNRGVWIIGNGEPIKLINDSGLREYDIASKLSTSELVGEVYKTVYGTIRGYRVETDEDDEVGVSLYVTKLGEVTNLEMMGFTQLLEDNELNNMEKANILCEDLGIEKRRNRQKIYTLLNSQK